MSTPPPSKEPPSKPFATRFEPMVNALMRPLIRRGWAPRAFSLLETTGRRSGVARQTPVNALLDGDKVWIVAEAGRQANYVQNLLAEPRVRIRVYGDWRSGRATVVDDADPVELRRRIEGAHGLVGRIDGLAFRAAASDMTPIRIDLDAASQ